MKKDPNVYLDDIIESIHVIAKYVDGVTYEQFENQMALQDAVLRRLEIIAEAARRIDESIKKSNTQIPWAKINGLRNAIIHDYDEIDLKAIWDTIKNDLPATGKDFIELKNSL